MVTSSRAKMGKLGGRTGIKYPIKKKKRNEKRIHKLEVESESGSASKTAVPVLFKRGEKKQSSLLYYGKYGTSRGSRGLCIYHGRSTENQKSKITTNYSNSTIPLLVPIFPPLTRVRLYSTLQASIYPVPLSSSYSLLGCRCRIDRHLAYLEGIPGEGLIS